MAWRLARFFSRPSITVDEAMLSLNLGTSSYADLAHSLTWGQTAPVPFLWAERLAADLFGMGELALRALPVLAGILVLPAAWWLARRLAEPEEALLAVALAAISPLLILYSVFVKPYTLDALVAVVLPILALDVARDPGTARRWLRLAGAGVVAVSLSTPAIFVLAGIGLGLAVLPAVRQQPRARLWLGGMAAVWVGLFVAQYALLYRQTADSAYMQEFWTASFLTPDPFAVVPRAWGEVSHVFSRAFVGSRAQAWGTIAFLALSVAGAVSVARRRGLTAAAFLVGPLGAAALASAVHRYPIAPRLMVFAVPSLALLLAVGTGAAARRLAPRRAGWTLAALGAMWIAIPLVRAANRPYRPDLTRDGIHELERLRREGEPVYVFAGAVPAWTYYTTDWTRPDTARLGWLAGIGGPGGRQFHNAKGRGRSVDHEGDDLVVRNGDRLELLGIPSGMQWRELTGPTQPWPDPGWAENEVRRMKDAGGGAVWVFFANYGPEHVVTLNRALRLAGAVSDFSYQEHGVEVYRYRFAP